MYNHFRAHMIDRARKLRRESTKPEQLLWNCLRNNTFAGISFRRQRPIGAYVVDFCSISHGLVIEVDGDTHDLTGKQDADRTKYLEAQGFRVIRFTNDEVYNHLEGVLKAIASVLDIPWEDVWKK